MRRAFTLIELLAVIVLVSMVAAIGAVGLAAGSEQAQLRSAIARWKNMDADARLTAKTGSVVALNLGDDQTTLGLVSLNKEPQFDSNRLPDQWTGRIEIAGTTSNQVMIDSRGRSEDYRVELRRAAGGQSIAWQVCGSTGWITEAEASR